MSKNIIFVFSGTGNSLWAAKEIAKERENCEIVSMGKDFKGVLTSGYDSIGFVFPTYAGGIPKRVKEFIANVDLQGNMDAYYFAVATCGRVVKAPNVITQIRGYLKRKGIQLHYGDRLDMYSNYVIGYEMRTTVREEADQSASDLRPMIESIKQHAANDGTPLTLRQFQWRGFILIVNRMDKGFSVSDACTKCSICRKVCPVGNIKMYDTGRPRFEHHCEQCLACIQNCPARAIDYKNKTQSRGRYRHPDISCKELAALNEVYSSCPY